jgi:hypothetical protein
VLGYFADEKAHRRGLAQGGTHAVFGGRRGSYPSAALQKTHQFLSENLQKSVEVSFAAR